MKNPDKIIPLKPSMIEPKYIPTLTMDPGNRKAIGSPSQNCCSVINYS